MRKRDVILDFTPLLDVIMIILFYFIIYCGQKVTTATEKQEQKAKAYEDTIATLQEQVDDAAASQAKADELLKHLQEDDAHSASNLQAITQFQAGGYLHLKLDTYNQVLIIDTQTASQSEIALGTAQNIADDIKAFLRDFPKEDTILGIFQYDGSAKDTRSTCKRIEEAFQLVREQYQYLYIAELDTSLGG